jgi:hypothetical protein
MISIAINIVFNTRILDAMNFANQDYMRVNYTLIIVYTMLLVTGSQTKNVSCFCLDIIIILWRPGPFRAFAFGPIAIADWSIIVQCHLLVKHGF